MSTQSSDTMLDPWDSLQAACNDADLWPENSIESQSFRPTTRSYQQQLRAESTRLFNTNRNTAFVELVEAFDGPFSTTRCRTLDDLRGHLQINRKDPRCRYVFFSARHSRAPMFCSKEMFDLVMTFHQTMPPLVDLVLGFGKPRSLQEFHYASFRSENYIGVSQGQKRAIPQLGRSGREIRHCFNLWSPEKSEASGTLTWPLRQAAAYHAFDVESGQSLWINFKANDVLKARIAEATTSCDSFYAESLSRLSGSFAAALTTHLILFEWCSENWRWYNKSLEEKLRDILDKVNNAPVEQVESILKYDAKMLVQTLRDNPPELTSKPPATRQNSTSSWSPSSPVRRMSRALTGLTTNTVQSIEHRSLSAPVPLSPLIGPPRDPPTQNTGGIQSEQDRDPFEVLQDFSIERLQCLNGIGADLHTSQLVMKLNADIMKEIITHYQSLWDDSEFPHDIKAGCKYSFLEFIRRTMSMVRSLEMEIARIGTLMLLLNDGRELFDKFLQLRHIEQSKLFTANAHQSAQYMQKLTLEMHESTKNMEKIAAKTEKETASMHIITLVTLVFLPGTFVATLFGSGLYQWDQEDPVGSVPVWKGNLFKLFAKICFPLMAGTIIIWLVLAYGVPWLQSTRRREVPPDEENVIGVGGYCGK